MTADNPFRAPEQGPIAAPGAGRVVIFVVGRAVHVALLGVVAVLSLTVAGSRDDLRWLLAPVISVVLWAPPAIVLFWASFLAPRNDPRALVFAHGEVVDRRIVRVRVRSGAAEAAVGAGMLALTGGLFVSEMPGRSPLLGVALVLVSILRVHRAATDVRFVEGVVAYASLDFARAREILRPLARGGLLYRPWRDRALVQTANAAIRMGDLPAAREALGAVRGKQAVIADVILAQLDVADGRLDEARAFLAAYRPGNVGQRLGAETLAALIALESGAADEILERARHWSDLEALLPERVRGSLVLLRAAALWQKGDRAAALEAWRTAAMPWEEIAWATSVWPAYGRALTELQAAASAGADGP